MTVLRNLPFIFSTNLLQSVSCIFRECFSLRIVDMISGNYSLYIFRRSWLVFGSRQSRLLFDSVYVVYLLACKV